MFSRSFIFLSGSAHFSCILKTSNWPSERWMFSSFSVLYIQLDSLGCLLSQLSSLLLVGIKYHFFKRARRIVSHWSCHPALSPRRLDSNEFYRYCEFSHSPLNCMEFYHFECNLSDLIFHGRGQLTKSSRWQQNWIFRKISLWLKSTHFLNWRRFVQADGFGGDDYFRVFGKIHVYIYF